MQTAQDVIHWSSDYTPLLKRVLQNTSVHFFHGGENLMMRAEDLGALQERFDKVSAEIIEGRAQLLIYAEPKKFAEALARQANLAS